MQYVKCYTYGRCLRSDVYVDISTCQSHWEFYLLSLWCCRLSVALDLIDNLLRDRRSIQCLGLHFSTYKCLSGFLCGFILRTSRITGLRIVVRGCGTSCCKPCSNKPQSSRRSFEYLLHTFRCLFCSVAQRPEEVKYSSTESSVATGIPSLFPQYFFLHSLKLLTLLVSTGKLCSCYYILIQSATLLISSFFQLFLAYTINNTIHYAICAGCSCNSKRRRNRCMQKIFFPVSFFSAYTGIFSDKLRAYCADLLLSLTLYRVAKYASIRYTSECSCRCYEPHTCQCNSSSLPEHYTCIL